MIIFEEISLGLKPIVETIMLGKESKHHWKREGDDEMVRPRGTDKAKVIQVIETESIRGNGTDTDPVRLIKQYWDFEGNLLAENDAQEKEKE